MKVFIDSNIPMYVAGSQHPHREPARRLLERVRSGEMQGYSSTEVLQEILYRYSALDRIDMAGAVYDLFVEVCPAILDVTLADTDLARQLLTASRRPSARDALHAAVMLNHGIERIATFDADFDSIAGIKRLSID